MGPLVIVLLGALAVFWYLGLLTPKRLNAIAGIAAILIGLLIAARGQYFIGLPLIGAGGFLAWRGFARTAASGAMTLKDAAALLKVKQTASVEEIRAAHRLAIASAHPDKGGTDAESAKLNEARDLLIASRMKDK
ncbi:molecular chaperone DnaJ [Pacificimonas sp. WHA3]|uniref:Molecular chaperone DnaJ n=1 Tax=Pacificimonas pallii TaxID=2827236 RepID=A0ABS6SBS8_9SPHN|nr:molecular chaperone DnaJ [Pacificimonas pallii]MBV7255371.1 molecular chaperone DnaJ [Pacificimonas pallii]